MHVTGAIKRYPVTAFYILALLIGASITYLVVRRVLAAGLIILAASSASLSGIIVTAITDGKPGLAKLFGRLLIWRTGIQWWILVVFFLGPAILLGLYLNPLLGGESIDLSNTLPLYQVVPMFLIFILTAGLGEELGWRGFLLPRLQSRYSSLVASIAIGVLWGLWHFPLFIYSGLDHPSLADFPYSGWVSQYGFPGSMAAFILFNQIPWSILYTWVFNNTKGSLLLIVVFHGSEVWVAYWQLSAGVNPGDLNNYLGYGVVMIVTVLIVVLVNGAKNLSRKHEKVVDREA